MELNYHRTGSGPTLVLIHGIGHHWQGWEPVLDRLAGERDVIAIDLPGFGESPMPPAGTPAGVGSLTDMVSGFLDDLEVERPHVAGNSLGGWISLELAKRGRVASATGLSPAGFHNRLEAVYQETLFRILIRTTRLIAPNVERILSRPRLRQLAFAQLVAHPLPDPAPRDRAVGPGARERTVVRRHAASDQR